MQKTGALIAMLLAAACLGRGCKRASQRPRQALLDYAKAVEAADKELFLASVYCEDTEYAEMLFAAELALAEFRKAFDQAYSIELLTKAPSADLAVLAHRIKPDLKIDQEGDRAVAFLDGGDSVELIRKDGRWKVDLRAATPTGSDRQAALARQRGKIEDVRALREKVGHPDYDAGMIISALLSILKAEMRDEIGPVGVVEPGAPDEAATTRPEEPGRKAPPVEPDPRRPPPPPRPKVVWDVPGWQDAPSAEARFLRGSCRVVKKIPGRTASAVAGVDFGPKAVSRLEPAYETFRTRHFQAFEAGVAADRALREPYRKTHVLDGVEYDRMIAQTGPTVGTVLVAIRYGRCAAYWFRGHMDCFGLFVRELPKARIEERARD